MKSKLIGIALAGVLALISAGCAYDPVYDSDSNPDRDYNYYFYPEVGVYFHVPTGYYYYRENGYWRHSHHLPSYIVIDQRHRHPFYYRGHDPYKHYDDHYRKWGRDRRDYRDRRDHRDRNDRGQGQDDKGKYPHPAKKPRPHGDRTEERQRKEAVRRSIPEEEWREWRKWQDWPEMHPKQHPEIEPDYNRGNRTRNPHPGRNSDSRDQDDRGKHPNPIKKPGKDDRPPHQNDSYSQKDGDNKPRPRRDKVEEREREEGIRRSIPEEDRKEWREKYPKQHPEVKPDYDGRKYYR